MKNTTVKPKPVKPAGPAKPVKVSEAHTDETANGDPEPTPGRNGQQIEPAGSPYGPPKE